MAWNRPNQLKVKHPRKKFRMILCLSAGIVAVLICAFFFRDYINGRHEEPAVKASKHRSIKAFTHNATKAAAREPNDQAFLMKSNAVERVKNNSATVSNNVAEDNGLPSNTTGKDTTFVFEDPADFYISQYLQADGKRIVPPPPPIGAAQLEKLFDESLKKEIVILPDDPEKVKERKRQVIEAKKEIQNRRELGLSVLEILQEHEKLANENAQIRSEVRRKVVELKKSGDVEGAKQLMDQTNAQLIKMGIEEVEWPKSLKERQAETAARRAAKERKN